jgi:recombinational DNA repair protein RecR
MKDKLNQLIDSIEPLISIQLQYADRLDLDTIQITTARARETLKQLRELQKEINSDKKPSSFYSMMDNKFAHAL